jgi:hypothetical protein
VQRASNKQHLKGAAGVEASSPNTGIRASAQYPYSEVTCHHGSLMHRGLLHRPPLRLASRGHATCPRPLHLHMVLSPHTLTRAVGGPNSFWGPLTLCSLEMARLWARLPRATIGVLDTEVSRSTCSWATSTTQLRPRSKMKTEAQQGRPS